MTDIASLKDRIRTAVERNDWLSFERLQSTIPEIAGPQVLQWRKNLFLWCVSKEAALALRALITERTLDVRAVSPECYRRRPRGLRPTRHDREQKTPRWFPAGLFIHGQTPVGIPPWARSNPA